MNYEKIYDQIIQRAKSENRKKRCGIYYESHHIIPKCMGGNNDKSTLVLLTAKEHYMAHRLLCLIYPNNNKLKFAIWAMSNGLGNSKRYMPSGRTYAQIKELYVSSKRKRDLDRQNLKLMNTVQDF